MRRMSDEEFENKLEMMNAIVDFYKQNEEYIRPIQLTITKALKELEEYHEIGLTPDQLRQVDKLYEEKCRELARYQDLEEQGILLKLPCKLGDTLYWISDLDEDGNEKRTIMPTNPVVAIAIKKDGVYVSIYEGLYDKLGSRFAFTSKEDAEEVLKKMNETEI